MTIGQPTKRSRAINLGAGLLVFAAMTLTLGEIAEDVQNREPLTVTDVRFSAWLHTHSTPLLSKAMWIVTTLHASTVVCFVAVVVGLLLWRRRERFWAVAFWLCVFGGLLLNKTLKFIFHRARPRFDDAIQMLTSYSFPSGHTMIATVFYGALTAFVFAKTKNLLWRALATSAAISLIMLVAFSRVYLGAHYLSDVLGAMAEGLAWIALSLTALYYFWNRAAA